MLLTGKSNNPQIRENAKEVRDIELASVLEDIKTDALR